MSSIAMGLCSSCQTPPSHAEVQGVWLEDEEISLRDLIPAQIPEVEGHKAAYYYLWATSLQMRGEGQKAQDFFEKAYTLSPNSFLAEKMMFLKKDDPSHVELIDQAHKMVLLYPKQVSLRLFYSETLARAGQLTEAIGVTEEALTRFPAHQAIYIQLINLYKMDKMDKKAEDKALDLAGRFTRDMPQLSLGWTMLGHLYFLKDDFKKAAEALGKAYALETASLENGLFYARLLDVTEPKTTGRSDQIFYDFYKDNLNEEELMARTMVFLKAYGSVEACHQRLESLKVTPQTPVLFQNLRLQTVLLLWELNKNKEAFSEVSNLQTVFGSSPQILYMKAKAYERLQDMQNAEATYKSIAKGSRYYVPAQLALIQLSQTKDAKQALDILYGLLDDPHVHWEVYSVGAAVYGEQKQYGEAVALLEKGAQRFPGKVRLRFLRGIYLERMGQLKACIEVMKEIIQQYPSESQAYNFLGYLFAEQGVFLDEAESLILKALSFKPTDGYYLDSLGYLYYRQKKTDKALEILKKAMELSPHEPVILEHLADVLIDKQDIGEAFKLLEQAVQLPMDLRDQDRILKKFETLQKQQGASTGT